MAVMIPVSWGELFDKLTILRIKSARISDDSKRANISAELTALERIPAAHRLPEEELQRLIAELHQVNEALWDIEDGIRQRERERDFSERFIELARSVYRTNDKRAELKRAINDLLGSDLVEEKSYAAY